MLQATPLYSPPPFQALYNHTPRISSFSDNPFFIDNLFFNRATVYSRVLMILIIKVVGLPDLIYDNQMSQRQFSKKRQQELLRQVPHSQKSAVSAKESHKRKKEAAKWTKKRNNLVIERDWDEKQAHKHWKNAKEFEAQGWIDMALEVKKMCEHHSLQVKNTNRQIIKIDNMIKSLSLEYPTNGLQKGKNYATMKVEEPPSDNEE